MDASDSIWSWIVEFILLEPIDSEWADNVIAVIPPSRLSDALLEPRIKKSVHLRSLAYDLHHRSFTFRTLETLEHIEEIDRPAEITDSMCRAYWAVATECTARSAGGDEDGAGGGRDFEDFVDRLWKTRTGDLNGVKAATGLLSANLLRWQTRLARTVPELEVLNQLLRQTTKEKAVELLGLYLTEVMQQLGPSFLHIKWRKAGKVGIDALGTGMDASAEVLGASKDGGDAGGSDGIPSSEMVAPTLGNVPEPVDATTGDISAVAALNEKQQARKNETGMPKEGLHGDKYPSGPLNQTCTMKEKTGVNQNQGKRIPPLMSWNPTAQTDQWGEDSDLPTPEEGPRGKKWSNFRKAVRRVPRKWSVEEEDILRKAVGRYGKGRWKLILNIYQATFEGRTEVDLKDKWRNMTAR